MEARARQALTEGLLEELLQPWRGSASILYLIRRRKQCEYKGYLRELGVLHETYYGLFRGRTEDTGKEGSGWNEYGKMARRETHVSRLLGRTFTCLGPAPDPCSLACLLVKSHG